MTREIKEFDRKLRRNVWSISRKLQGLFLTLSFSRQNLEEKNTGISRPFLCVETIIWWGKIGVCPGIYDYLFWVCSCPEGEESRGYWVICKDKIRRKKTLCSTPKCTAQGLKSLVFLGSSQAAKSRLFRAVRGYLRFPITTAVIGQTHSSSKGQIHAFSLHLSIFPWYIRFFRFYEE